VISFIDKIWTFGEQRWQTYKNKLMGLVFLFLAVAVLVIALAIAISKIITAIIVVCGCVALGIWAFLKITKMELSTLINYVRDVLNDLLNLIRDKEDELDNLLDDPAEFSLIKLLSLANEEEREGLEKFAGTKFESAEQFDLTVREKATNDIGALIKRIKGVDKEFAIASYSDMLDLAGDKFKLKRESKKDRDFEAHIVKTAFDKMVDAMDDKDRKLLEHEISKYAEEHLGKKNLNIALAGGGILAAKLGGFGAYIMTTTLLHGVTTIFGVVLPFAVYTNAMWALGVVLGPIGIGALGIWGLQKITAPDTKTTILIVLAAASIRERLIYEYPQKRQKLKAELDFYISQKTEIEALLANINNSNNLKTAFAAITHKQKPAELNDLR
jgi:uncharacterized protein YaaW (UPF0174 family)